MNVKTILKIDKKISKLKKEPKIKIRFRQEYKNINYMVTIEKPKSLFVSIYLANEIFFNEMIKKPFVYGYNNSGYYDKEKLKLIKVLNIKEIDKPKSIFKRF